MKSILIVTSILALGSAGQPVLSADPSPHVSSTVTDSEAGPGFDIHGYGTALNGWRKKRGQAAEYGSAGSNYRTWKPTVSRRPDGGLFVSTKLDHIRGLGRDDHAQIELTFDAAGQLTAARTVLDIAGRQRIDTGVITAVTGSDPVAFLATEIFNTLWNVVQQDHGGRQNFPAVVEHNINLIAQHVR